MKSIKTIKSKNFTWHNVSKIDKSAIDFLRDNYKFHPLDLEDCASPAQRPKLDEYDDYLFMILLFPVYSRKTKRINDEAVYFFISNKYLITVHNGNLNPLADFFSWCQKSEHFRKKFMGRSSAELLHEILDRLLMSCFPMLDHISLDIGDTENKVFNGYERHQVKEILRIKINIVTFRKVMQAHKNVIKKLIVKNSKFFSEKKLRVYYLNLIEHTKNIWDILENLKDTVWALEDTNDSLISFRLNDIMKMLTVISVTMLPITLVASVFGMNTVNMPVVSHPDGFWMILGIMSLISLALILYFKKKKWM